MRWLYVVQFRLLTEVQLAALRFRRDYRDSGENELTFCHVMRTSKGAEIAHE